MRSMGKPKKNARPVRVMVRAFGGRPVELLAVAVWPECVEVASALDRSKSVGFRRDAVYEYRGDLFNQLCAAHRSGHPDRVAALWQKAERFSPAE